MAKPLCKAIMKKSVIRTMFNKEKSAKTWSDYKEQSNF